MAHAPQEALQVIVVDEAVVPVVYSRKGSLNGEVVLAFERSL
jgi:hypothetical protein